MEADPVPGSAQLNSAMGEVQAVNWYPVVGDLDSDLTLVLEGKSETTPTNHQSKPPIGGKLNSVCQAPIYPTSSCRVQEHRFIFRGLIESTCGLGDSR